MRAGGLEVRSCRGDQPGRRRVDPEQLQRPVGTERRQSLAAVMRSVAAACPPLLPAGEVGHVRELHVAHRRAARDRDRQRVEGKRPLGVERAVDRVDHHMRGPPAPQLDLAALLRHRRQRRAERLELGEDRVLRRPVDHQRDVATLAATRRLGALSGCWVAPKLSPDAVGRPSREAEPVVGEDHRDVPGGRHARRILGPGCRAPSTA
jgi:hypothetical protein